MFMSQLTGRYTGSSESQIQKDLDRIELVAPGDTAGFTHTLNEIIGSQLTSDFWQYNMPQQLITSGGSISPHYQGYLAALNILDAPMFMLDEHVSDWMDPSQPAAKGTETHHLFPRKYQENVLGISDMKRINQAANYAPTDWNTNIKISDKAPSMYWPQLVAERSKGEEWLTRQMYFHAMPRGWENMEYEEFLAARRHLMAQVTRDAYEKLSAGLAQTDDAATPAAERAPEPELAELIERDLLRAGDHLDPVDPTWEVDAVVTEDGTILIDGVEEFDSLDDAARYLEVTNISGFEFWALELDGDVIPLTTVAGNGGRPAVAIV